MFWQRLKGFMPIGRSRGDETMAWPHLKGFISSCLHQDADITGGEDPNDRVFFGNVVADYCKGTRVEARQAVIAEIDAITAQVNDISEDFLDGLGMGYGTGSLTPRKFLMLLRDLLVEHLEDPLASPLPHDPNTDPWGPMRRRRT